MIEGKIKQVVWMALVLSIVVLATAASASAAEKEEHHPTGLYAIFNQCPLERPDVTICIFAEGYGGEFQVGGIDVPITKPLFLQVGLANGGVTTYPAADGESFQPAAEVASGGIFGLVKEGRYPWYLRNFCKNFPNNSECRVTVTPEEVGPPSMSFPNIVEQVGTALEIPLRLHLKNPFLGGKCYIGSASSPITVRFTDGNKPPLGVEPEMQGSVGHGESYDQGSLILTKGSELVDNAYSTPGAEGCGGPQSLIVDREIDEKQGLPAPAGHNRARLIAAVGLSAAEAVRASE